MSHPLELAVLQKIGAIADRAGVDAYVVGGYVRDYYLRRPSVDIDIVVVGDGIAIARALGRELHTGVSIFKTFGTAMLRDGELEIQFVGARKESYSPSSRNPSVEAGTLYDDQLRRDFTINALAWSLNQATYGDLLDPFDGINDLENRIIKTPKDDADGTFSDDPLRMMRAIRFATQLGFDIAPETFEAIQRNRERINIITTERIVTELNKIIAAPAPSIGFELLDLTGLLPLVFPELTALKGVRRVGKHAHKDVFVHTLQVLDNVARKSDDLWLRWAALLHDIAKPATKSYSPATGWSFHGHEVLGSKWAVNIFRRMRLPMGDPLKFVRKMVFLHLRPIVLSEEEVTDSAVRRLLFEAGDDIEALMTLCEADITSGDEAKRQRYLSNFALVREKLHDIEERDRIRNFQPPISGDLIMMTYNLPPCALVGEIKAEIKEAILDGRIPNDYDAAYALMEQLVTEKLKNQSPDRSSDS